MEALGGVASAFAVVQIADRVLTLCGSYVIEVKEAQKEVKRIQDELFNLKIVLERIDKLTSSNSSSPNPTLHANPELYRIISSCKELLHDVETKLESGIRPATMRRFGKRALKWPFKSKDVTKILDSLDRNKTSLNLILNVEQRCVIGIIGIRISPILNYLVQNWHLTIKTGSSVNYRTRKVLLLTRISGSISRVAYRKLEYKCFSLLKTGIKMQNRHVSSGSKEWQGPENQQSSELLLIGLLRNIN